MSDVDGPEGLESATLRQRIAAWAQWGVHNEPQIHYEQRRPVDGLNRSGQLPLHTDCSGFVTLCYKWSGAPDPNGGNYRGTVYTGTLLRHCHPITEAQLQPGDLVVFGGGTGSHVVIMVGSGPSGLVVSHGAEHAPNHYPLTRAKSYFARPARPLRCPGLGAFLAGEADPDEEMGASVEFADVSDDPNASNSPAGEPDTAADFLAGKSSDQAEQS